MSEQKVIVTRVAPDIHRKVKASLLMEGLTFQDFGEVVAEAIASDRNRSGEKAVRTLMNLAKTRRNARIRARLDAESEEGEKA